MEKHSYRVTYRDVASDGALHKRTYECAAAVPRVGELVNLPGDVEFRRVRGVTWTEGQGVTLISIYVGAAVEGVCGG